MQPPNVDQPRAGIRSGRVGDALIRCKSWEQAASGSVHQPSASHFREKFGNKFRQELHLIKIHIQTYQLL